MKVKRSNTSQLSAAECSDSRRKVFHQYAEIVAHEWARIPGNPPCVGVMSRNDDDTICIRVDRLADTPVGCLLDGMQTPEGFLPVLVMGWDETIMRGAISPRLRADAWLGASVSVPMAEVA